MNCQEVQAQLSDYLEKSLDAANLEIIENHLSTCLSCHAEADHFKECIGYVATLPTLDVPIGFTQRVMARVREIDERPGFWERWFLPLRIKIPIQATALVLIGILGVYLLDKEQPDKPAILTSETTVSKNPFPRTEQGNGTAESRAALQQAPAKSNPLPGARAQSFAAPAPKSAQAKTTGGPNERVAQNRVKSPAEEQSDSSSPSTPPVEPRARPSGLITGTPVINSAIGSGQLPSPAEFESGSLRPGSMSIEPFADYEMVFRLHSALQDQARTASEKPAARALAERQATPGVLDRLLAAVADNTRPQTVWLTVPKSQYEQLKKDLRAVGTIESETLMPLLRAEPGAQTNGQLQIKLTVFPAPEANRATPSSSADR